jgi:hypothetical protein
MMMNFKVHTPYVNLPTVVAVVRATIPNGVAHAADVFHVEDGAIRSMRICSAVAIPAAATD